MNRIYVLICASLLLFVSNGCVNKNPLITHYENNFAHFHAPGADHIKSSPIQRTFYQPYDEVWNSALSLLAQHELIIDASREKGVITYLSIDGLYFGDVFPRHYFCYWDFSYAAYFEEKGSGVNVHIYPMVDMYDERTRDRDWWKVVDAGFMQKGNEFMERLSTQLMSGNKWQWLRK